MQPMREVAQLGQSMAELLARLRDERLAGVPRACLAARSSVAVNGLSPRGRR